MIFYKGARITDVYIFTSQIKSSGKKKEKKEEREREEKRNEREIYARTKSPCFYIYMYIYTYPARVYYGEVTFEALSRRYR